MIWSNAESLSHDLWMIIWTRFNCFFFVPFYRNNSTLNRMRSESSVNKRRRKNNNFIVNRKSISILMCKQAKFVLFLRIILHCGCFSNKATNLFIRFNILIHWRLKFRVSWKHQTGKVSARNLLYENCYWRIYHEMHSAAGIDNNGVFDILRGWIKRTLQFNLLWLMLLNKFIERTARKHTTSDVTVNWHDDVFGKLLLGHIIIKIVMFHVTQWSQPENSDIHKHIHNSWKVATMKNGPSTECRMFHPFVKYWASVFECL